MKNLKSKYFITLVFVFLSPILFGQINCIDSDQKIGCAPFLAQLEYCGPLQDNDTEFPTIYEYENNAPTIGTSYTYNQPGLYSVKQRIAIKAGQPTQDSVFIDFFRVVSSPNLLTNITSCKNKELHIDIDSSSYDYYLITNDLNSESDTIFNNGSFTKSFISETENKVNLTIQGKYYSVDCGTEENFEVDLIDEIIPKNILEFSEFDSLYIAIDGYENIKYELQRSKNGTTVDIQAFEEEENIYSITIPNISPESYDSLTLIASDFCGNKDQYLHTPTFQSTTVFENNQNIISQESDFENITFVKMPYVESSSELDSNIDTDIVCGNINCYSIKKTENYNNVSFNRFATGNCGTSFSIDKPAEVILSIDNSGSHTKLTFDPETDVNTISVNNQNYLLDNTLEISLPKTQDCLTIQITNNCNQSTTPKEYCPLTLEENVNQLTWNTENENLYNLAWISVDGDTIEFATDLTDNYTLEANQFFAQSFCILLTEQNSNNISNTICFEDLPFLFIPDIVYVSNETINVSQKYLKSFNFKLFDINGNLVIDSNNNDTINIQEIKKGTYFYMINAETEKAEIIEKNGSILIKN